MNRWEIDKDIEKAVLKRDLVCVHCHRKFGSSRKSQAPGEHTINDVAIAPLENVTRSCISCNASKGAKSLKDWFESKYRKENKLVPPRVDGEYFGLLKKRKRRPSERLSLIRVL